MLGLRDESVSFGHSISQLLVYSHSSVSGRMRKREGGYIGLSFTCMHALVCSS